MFQKKSTKLKTTIDNEKTHPEKDLYIKLHLYLINVKIGSLNNNIP